MTASTFGRRLRRRLLNRETVLGSLSVLVILTAWEVGSQTGAIDPRFFPAPSTVFGGFLEMYTSGEFLAHFQSSIRRILVGFAVGASTGVVAGLAMGWSVVAKTVLDPYVSLLYPIPKIVILPVLFILLGVGEPARLITISLAVFLTVSINSMSGVVQIEDVYVEAARDNGSSGLALFREVILPGALPQIFTGLSLGIGITFILLVLIEMVGANTGLGYVIWNSWEQFTIVRMYVAILTINFLGIVCVYGIEALGKVLTPWR